MSICTRLLSRYIDDREVLKCNTRRTRRHRRLLLLLGHLIWFMRRVKKTSISFTYDKNLPKQNPMNMRKFHTYTKSVNNFIIQQIAKDNRWENRQKQRYIVPKTKILYSTRTAGHRKTTALLLFFSGFL